MTEDNLWEWLRDVVLPYGDYSRIESAHTSPGFPDIDYCLGHQLSGQIELKYSKLVEIPFPGKPGLRKSQLTWIRKRVRCFGYVWIIAEAPPDIYVIPGQDADRFNGATRDELKELSVAVLQRDDPGAASVMLHNVLHTWRYDK